NDVHGHAVGDELLQQTARRLESCIRAEDTVARLGGDEFGVVLATLAHPQDCEAVAAKIILALATPFELEHQVVNVSASIGAALFPQHGSDDAVLLARADAAMYVAKNTGKNRFSWDRVADCES
ncbi:MAG TPA: GGDEF domain-containing protein, partial [Luteimonas sp.]|nr:GGDEF domain-containing protein [Luteimonas sp.]